MNGLAEPALVASVVFAGLWTGFLTMLTTILHPVCRRMEGRGFARFMSEFLATARTAPANYVAILGMVLASAAALVALADDPGGAPFVLTGIGLVASIGGPVLASRYMAEPIYAQMLAWDPDAMPEGWQAVRARYFAVNWVRGAATATAFGAFLAALVVL